MKVIHSRVDIERTRASWPSVEFNPAHVIAKKDNLNWQILDAPYSAGVVPSFASAAADKYIRIPLFAYKLPATGDAALAHMLQMGLSFVNYTKKDIAVLHIVTGHPVELTYKKEQLINMVFWVGFALALRD